jgi:hypothetical protein
VRLFTFFADQLSALINQIVFEKQNSEPPLLREAREYIQHTKWSRFRWPPLHRHPARACFHANHRRNFVRTLAQRNGAPRPRNFAMANLNKIGLMIGVLVRRRARSAPGLELIQQIPDQVRARHHTEKRFSVAIHDRDGMKFTFRQHLRRIANGGGFQQRPRRIIHDLFERYRVIQRGIHRPLVRSKGIAEADAQNVGKADDPDDLPSADDRKVLDALVAHELAGFGDWIAVMHRNEFGAHDFGDRFIAFHCWDLSMYLDVLLFLGCQKLCGSCDVARQFTRGCPPGIKMNVATSQPRFR